MPDRSRSDTIRSYFSAYKSKDREIVKTLLSEDFTFTSPYDDAIDTAAYFARCWPNSEHIKTHIVERIFEQGNEAFVAYKCITNDDREFRNTEFFVFEGDRIRRIDVYFGATHKHGAFVKSSWEG